MATIPSGRLLMAPGLMALAALAQGGLSHCTQLVGMKMRETWGYSPTSTSGTARYVTPGGDMFSAMQATAHELQPEHFLVLITMIQLRWFTGFFRACWMSSCMAWSSAVRVGAELSIDPSLLWDTSVSRLRGIATSPTRHLRKKKETGPRRRRGRVSFANSGSRAIRGNRNPELVEGFRAAGAGTFGLAPGSLPGPSSPPCPRGTARIGGPTIGPQSTLGLDGCLSGKVRKKRECVSGKTRHPRMWNSEHPGGTRMRN